VPNHGQFLDSFIVSTHIDKQEFVSNIFTYIYIYIYMKIYLKMYALNYT
jgi:hypothetical protein